MPSALEAQSLNHWTSREAAQTLKTPSAPPWPVGPGCPPPHPSFVLPPHVGTVTAQACCPAVRQPRASSFTAHREWQPRGRLPRPSLGPVLAPPSPGLGWGFSVLGRVLGCLFLPIHATSESRAASCHWLLGAQSQDLAHSTWSLNGKEEGGEEEWGKGRAR